MTQSSLDTNCILADRKCTLVEIRKLRKFIKTADCPEILNEIKTILHLLKTVRKEDRTEYFMDNAVRVLGVLASKEISVKDEDEEESNADEWDKPTFTKFKIGMTQIWSEVMKWEDKSQQVHRKILKLLPEKIIRCLTNPLHTSDYLVSSFDFGGPLALYSLKGLFVLMNSYNLEVPDFYTRLYSLFNKDIYSTPFQPDLGDFLKTVDIFLMSSHLPETLVAAFVKKLARLCLWAPAPFILLIFPFIQNLMVRHPGLVTMIHARNKKKVQDPFLPFEKEPTQSKAIESCLWEVKTLQNHVLSVVGVAAKFIDKPIGKQEVPWMENVDLTYQDVIRTQLSKKIKLELCARVETFDTSPTIEKIVFNNPNHQRMIEEDT